MISSTLTGATCDQASPLTEPAPHVAPASATSRSARINR